MEDFVSRQKAIDRCKAIKALAEKDIEEYRSHTAAYKRNVGIMLSIACARQRKAEMDDMIRWLEDQEPEDVKTVVRAHKVTHNRPIAGYWDS